MSTCDCQDCTARRAGVDLSRIHVEYIFPPIPLRNYDYCATFDDYEPGQPMGYGPTRQAAMDDLLEQHAELQGEQA